MSIYDMPILVGVYDDETQARDALEKLEQAGFDQQQIRMVMRKGILIPHQILDDLISVGIPEEDALIYEREFQAGHIIVLVRHDGRINAAFKSLYNLTINISVIMQKRSEQQGTDGSSSSVASEEALSQETDESLWKLLKDAGLDHLL